MSIETQHTAEYVTLRDYIDLRINTIEKSIAIAHQAALASYPTREEFTRFKSDTEEDIRFLREARALLEGKASQASVNDVREAANEAKMLAYVSMLLSFIFSVVTLILKLSGI